MVVAWLETRPALLTASAAIPPGPLFTKRTDILSRDLVKTWGREIRV